MLAFECYDPSSDGTGGFHAWYASLSAVFQAQVDTALEDLALERNVSSAKIIESLHGACAGLLEIKIDFGPDEDHLTSLRILCFERSRRTLTLLVGFEKTPTAISYGPHCRSALERKNGVTRDGRRAKPCQFP